MLNQVTILRISLVITVCSFLLAGISKIENHREFEPLFSAQTCEEWINWIGAISFMIVIPSGLVFAGTMITIITGEFCGNYHSSLVMANLRIQALEAQLKQT